MRLLAKLNLILFSVFIAGFLPTAWLTRELLRSNARDQAVDKARLMMETAMAVRGYTIKEVKPLIADRLSEEFLPQSVPAYSASEVFATLRTTNAEYSYKEATLNPTNPRNRTLDWEADIVEAFRGDPQRLEILGERDTPQGRSLFLGHPIRIKDPNCLACHDTADTAPASLVKKYGPSNGFGWKVNEVIGAQLVSVPLAVPLRRADEAFKRVALWLVGGFLVTLAVTNLLLRFTVVGPLRRLSAMADQVSLGNFDAPEVAIKGKDEVAHLSASFGRMRISLKKAMSILDEP
jgi:HAMP domain-containing protein